ncbi:T9SS type A sorting domain-containing protein [Nonlabens sp. Asnod2-A12]|uniref:T9SS type A sorting domain-containing protein n=1 Tax=Nonlabens sp. Asnod2-A12 TaxID=3160578 RepID=UPI0038697332
MKQIYFSVVMFFIAATSFAQQPIITSIVDGDCSGGNPKLLEIYASGTVDFTLFSLENQTNGNTTWGSAFDLSGFGTVTDGFIYVTTTGSAGALATEFPGLASATVLTDNVINLNGDDRIRIIETATSTVIDQYGVSGVDGTAQTWEYADSSAKRINGTGPDNGFVEANWVFGGAGSLNNLGVCQGGTDTFETLIGGIGTYTTVMSTVPAVTITAPSDGSTLAGGTTTTDIIWNSMNLPAGATFNVSVNGTDNLDVTSPYSITVMDGVTYNVTVSMVNGAMLVTTDSTSFDVAFPCDLQLGTITETCQTSTSGVDLYDVTIDFTGGSTSTYVIDTAGNGTVAGDDPSTVAAGQITITGVTEGVDFTVTVTGDAANSSCTLTRNISSPACLGNVTCANPGDLIITEIMQNPASVNDNLGEYFEVYNTTGAAIDMLGYEIVDLTNANENFTVILSVIVPANGYAVFVASADPLANGGITPDYVYDGTSMFLGNSSDELSIQCGGTVIDEVSWDNGATFPDGIGMSMELSLNSYNSTDNDLGTNWGLAVTAYGDGDLGTPGAVNDFTLSNDTFDANTFKIYPNPVNGSTVNIVSTNGEAVDVIIYSTLGQRVLTAAGLTNELNVSNLDSGMYIVKISQGNATQTRKLVIK